MQLFTYLKEQNLYYNNEIFILHFKKHVKTSAFSGFVNYFLVGAAFLWYRKYEPMSQSKIFLFLMLSFVAGIALRSFVFIDVFYAVFAASIVCIALFISAKYPSRFFFACLGVIMLCAGMLWYGLFEVGTLKLDAFIGTKIEITGVVTEEPDMKDSTQKLVVSSTDAPSEKILVSVKRYPEFAYHNVIHISGMLEKPKAFDNFDYGAYLAKDGIYFVMGFPDVSLVSAGSSGVLGRLFAFKNSFMRSIESVVPSPQSSFLNGMLFGAKSDLPKDVQNEFIVTGVSHITALSGYNITVIIIFVGFILSSFASRAVSFYLSVALVVVFVLATGASPSVIRAACMGIALLFARHIGRQAMALNALVFAAFVMLLFNPKILRYDVSFQLSFLAVLGLIYISPYFENKLKRIPDFLNLKESLIATLSAQIAVLPVILYAFHKVSLIAPLTNMLVLPVVPIAMLLGFVTGTLGFVSHYLALPLAYPLWLVLSYQLDVIHYFAQFSYAQLAL